MCSRLPLLAASSLEPPSQLVTTPHSGPMAENQVPWLQASTWKMKRCYPTCHGQQIQCGHMRTGGHLRTHIAPHFVTNPFHTQFSICEGPFWLSTLSCSTEFSPVIIAAKIFGNWTCLSLLMTSILMLKPHDRTTSPFFVSTAAQRRCAYQGDVYSASRRNFAQNLWIHSGVSASLESLRRVKWAAIMWVEWVFPTKLTRACEATHLFKRACSVVEVNQNRKDRWTTFPQTHTAR